jgi:hypothetical protein
VKNNIAEEGEYKEGGQSNLVANLVTIPGPDKSINGY